jgi:GntR family transcriptional regulator, transcriptional repressor for pyruvate dehydrogenase complex
MAMKHAFEPMERQSLSDRLARQIRGTIQGGDFRRGDRLPPIMEMARRFGVGHPTIREALKKLEAMGVVEIRHGSGVYVSRSEEVLVLAAPDYSGTLTKKLLIDLIRARTPLEMQSASDAVRNASAEDIREMQRQLALAGENLHNDDELNSLNMGFHYQVARSSGNVVLAQILGALHALFMNEQRLILDIFGSRERDHAEHLGILTAIEQRDETLATERMRAHLEGVLSAIEQWDPDHDPVT